MIFLLPVLLIAAALAPLRIRLFEATFSTLLLAPVLGFLVGHFAPLTGTTYTIIILAEVVVWYLLAFSSRASRATHITLNEILPLAVFAVVSLLCLSLVMLWPDFISIGERIRDFSLVATTIRSPLVPEEPWMSGSPLNYYVYWYRCGQMLSVLLNLEVWETYHRLQCFTVALFCASTFQFSRRVLNFSLVGSLATALLVTFGANCDGIHLAFSGSTDWWRPSRVIEGAINEFPAWSFLLGDLHPHYLNLPLFPLFFLCLLALEESEISRTLKAVMLGSVGFIIVPFWIFNSNAWEMPIWLSAVGSIAIVGAYASGWGPFKDFLGSLRLRELVSKESLFTISIILGAALSLYLSSRNILPGGDPVRLVRDPIKRSQVWELFRHWGFPLSAIALSTALLYRKSVARAGILGALLLCLLPQEGLPLLFVLLFTNLIRVWFVIEEAHHDGTPLPPSRLLVESLGLVSLGLLILPEIIFLDDPYGGENERMNTIFKVYTVNWFLLHSYAFYLASLAYRKLPEDIRTSLPLPIVQAAVVVVSLKFLWHIVPIRMSDTFAVKPVEQGLSKLEVQYPGAGEAIQQFARAPYGITLEAQGNAYSLTSHVSTLGNKSAFLGWANHVNLLTRNYGEVTRRENVTREFYSAGSCSRRLEILRTENIRYAVFGPLERLAFPQSEGGFECLSKIIQAGQYTIYSTKAESPL